MENQLRKRLTQATLMQRSKTELSDEKYLQARDLEV